MTVRLQIFGRVQGVFFRKSAKIEADSLDLVGWARNEDDGSVQILASGTLDNLKIFTKWCKDGPEIAQVHSVKENWNDETSDLEVFEAID